MRRLPLKIAAFSSVLAAYYILVVLALSSIYLENRSPVIQGIVGNSSVPGGPGHTLKRLFDIENYGNVDILFLGSSHTYRGFDPRIFRRYGFSSFNLGTTAQTPLNSYYLLKRYFEPLKPKLIIFEAYPVALSIDGLESFFNLVVNAQLSKDMLEMALALRNPQAVNSLIAAFAERVRRPLDAESQEKIEGEEYVAGGYCEATQRVEPKDLRLRDSRIQLSETQLDYLERLIDYSKERGAFVVLVVHPLPKELVASITNYREISQRLLELSERWRVPYIDFNEFLPLDTPTDFKDTHHLNASGVAKFNLALVRELSERGYIPPPASPLHYRDMENR